MELAERARGQIWDGHVTQASLGEPVSADAQDLQASSEVGGGLCGPPGVAADLRAGGRLGHREALHEVGDPFIEGHLAQVHAGVDDDARGAEDRRLQVVQLLERLLEESVLAHHALRVQPPALVEVGRGEHTPQLRRVDAAHHEVPVVAGVRLVDRGRRDAAVVVVLQARVDLLGRRTVGGEGHEEVAGQGVGEGGRRHIGRDAQHRTLEDRARIHGAALALGQADQPPIDQEVAGSLGPDLVGLAHRLLGQGVILVGGGDDLVPVWRACDAVGQHAHLRVQPVELALAHLAQRPGVVGERLPLLEHGRVALLSEDPRAVGLVRERAQEGSPSLERLRDRRPGGAQTVLELERRDLVGQELADVAGAALRRGGRPVDDQRVRKRRVQVGAALLQQTGGPGQAGAGGLDEVLIRAQSMQEQREQAVGDGARVGERVAAPASPFRLDQAPAQHRDGKVTVDPLVGGQVRVRQRLESPQVRRHVRIPQLEGVRG